MSQPWIAPGERSGLRTRIAATEGVSLCAGMKSWLRFWNWKRSQHRRWSPRERLGFGAGNFCKAKDKESAAGKRSSRYQSHQGDKCATPDSTRGRVDDGPLRADHRRLFMLCWAARTSDVLIIPAPEESRACARLPAQPTRLPLQKSRSYKLVA
jgi:hypothetical protein